MPGMIPYKRVAVADTKSGLPVYQPGAANIASYQQAIAAMHLQQQLAGQQQYVPVACKYHHVTIMWSCSYYSS